MNILIMIYTTLLISWWVGVLHYFGKIKGIDESVLKYVLKYVFSEVRALAKAIGIATAHTVLA